MQTGDKGSEVASKGREGGDREDKGTGVVKCKLKCKSARGRDVSFWGELNQKNYKYLNCNLQYRHAYMHGAVLKFS